MSNITKLIHKAKNGNEIILRTAAENDASQIIELMMGVIDEKLYTLAEADEYFATEQSEAKRIARFLGEKGKVYIVAVLNITIIGYIYFDNWSTRRTAHTGLLSMFIKKRFP